jgi:hypothetical protein
MRRSLFALAAVVASAAASVAGSASAAAPATCTSGLTVFSTSTGVVTVTGNVTHFQASGVGGSYTSGFLAGFSFTGSQNIERNDATQNAVLEGQYVATGPSGTVTVHFTGTVDLTTGAATGHFTVLGGTGAFAGFHWTGDTTAQLVSLTPPTFVGTSSGFCTSP